MSSVREFSIEELYMKTVRVLVTTLALAAAVLFLAPTQAKAAAICSFGGVIGGSGVDCLGHAWTSDGLSFGIPGLGLGTTGYLGTVTATDFHFEVDGQISPLGASGCGFDTTTRFSVAPFECDGSTLWK